MIEPDGLDADDHRQVGDQGNTRRWPNGKVTGLPARGGHQVDMEWKGGKITNYQIRSREPVEVEVRVGSEMKTIHTEKP